ncbi:MAG: hypothetical protein KatS3mg057_2092 [Herpetosiphonaceae bacterium]|nr:MAG: hypothetical protein KatS3mg057_2092 [Herpetosiphonaceae bacterium]
MTEQNEQSADWQPEQETQEELPSVDLDALTDAVERLVAPRSGDRT